MHCQNIYVEPFHTKDAGKHSCCSVGVRAFKAKVTGWLSWSRSTPRSFCEASTWILMHLSVLKYHRRSVQTRLFTVSKASLYDSFHVNTMPFLNSSWRGALKGESEGTNGYRYVNSAKNFWSCVGVSAGGMMCTGLTLEGSGCAPSLSKIHSKKVTNGFLTALFFTIEHKAMFMSNFHQFVEASVMFFIIPAMDN